MKYAIEGSTLEGIADAIRQKRGTTEKLSPSEFKTEVLAIETKKPYYDGTVDIESTGDVPDQPEEDIKGTWLLNDEIPMEEDFLNGKISVRFKSRGTTYSSMEFYTLDTKYIMYGSTSVYNSDESLAAVGWAEQGYRYIEILSDISEVDYPGALLEFLRKRGEKIEDPLYRSKFDLNSSLFSNSSYSANTYFKAIDFPFLWKRDTISMDSMSYSNRIRFEEYGINTKTYQIHIKADAASRDNVYYEGTADGSSVIAFYHSWSLDKVVWSNDGFKSLYISCRITDISNGYTVLQFLNKNATKSTYSREILNFSIDGIDLQATTVMTFKEWCESPYNTIGATCGGFDDLVVIGDRKLDDIRGYYAVRAKSYTTVQSGSSGGSPGGGSN